MAGEVPRTVRNLETADIVARLGLVERYLGNQELTETEAAELNTIGWIHEDDAETIREDPAIIASQKAISESRHTIYEKESVKRGRLTEWHVLLRLAVQIVPSETESADGTAAA